MAEGIAFDLVTGVVGKLGSALWDEIGLLRSFKDDADDLRSNFSAIQAVLLDAEERSSAEIEGTHSLRDWLGKLKDAAYDADDLLDLIRTEAEKVRGFLSRANPMHLKFKLKMAHTMKELRKKIDKIAKQRHDFGLVEAGPRRQAEFKRPETTVSVVDEEKIVGRDDDKEEIVKLLLDTNGDHDVSVIPIVGLGGLGKTTLAQLAFNDGRVTAELRVWVCVSTDFNMQKIGKPVISAAQAICHDTNDEDEVARCLVKIFSEKRFLLVLDDVWNEEQDKWENLKVLFKDGKKGSKILVTTRSEKVAEIMKTTEQPHRLKGLSDDDCWTLFKRRAFKEGEENGYPDLVSIGRQIVKKCGGVPLAANALGSMMRFKKRTEDAWSAIRDSEIWRLEEEKTILSLLKWSYIQMPSALKRCFAYCSIFPKDSKIYKDDLIQQWIALGFISSRDTTTLMEDIGNEYFDELLWRSFLQETYRGGDTFRMHDLVHDLAQSVASKEVAVIVGEESTRIREGCRYASIHSRSIQQVPTIVKQRLRALRFGESAALMTFCSEAKCLRLLDLHDCLIFMLPSSIGKLKLLRYLNLSGTNIQELPESITGLCNLQTLNLSNCFKIHTLPKSLGSLANLQFLDLSSCSLIIPDSISNLQNLYKLNLSSCRKLRSLEPICHLKNLHDLNLSSLENLQALPESIGKLENLRILDLSSSHSLLSLPESIGNLENLRILNLSGCSCLLSLPSSLCQLKNLHDLNLSNLGDSQALPESIGNLENLRILNLSYRDRLLSLPSSLCQLKNLLDLNLSNLGDLQALPESIGNLENLRILNLSECSSLLSLPESIGNLENLRILNLSKCCRLQSLPSSLCQLKNLHDLNLSNLDDLQTLPESIGNLKNLRILNISWCSSLLSLPSSSSDLQHLEKLNISCCRLCELPKMIENLTKLRELLNEYCWELKGMPRGIGKLVSLQKLSDFVVGKQGSIEHCASISELKQLNNLVGELEIYGLENVTNPVDAKAANLIEKKKLRSLRLRWNMDTVQTAEEMDAVLENLQPHQNLEKLVIEGYAGGKFPSWMMNRIDSCLPNLVELNLEDMPRCSSLLPLGQLPLLERLTIRNKFPALRRLELYEEGRRERVPIFPRLAKLTLEKCPQLGASVESLRSLTTLESVTIRDCEDLGERIEDWIGELTKLKELYISGCQSLRYLPAHKMTSLERLYILDCPLLFNAGGDVRVNERPPEPCLPTSLQVLSIIRMSKEFLSLILKRPTMDSETPPDDDYVVSLQQPNMMLQKLMITNCQPLTCLPESLRSFTSLQELTIDCCDDLERIEDWLGELTKLQYLYIWSCQSLRYLPAHKMTSLEKLHINGCPLLFNADGQFVDTNVDHIRYIKVDGREYKHKKQVSSSSQEEEKKSWTRCWGKLDWSERRA